VGVELENRPALKDPSPKPSPRLQGEGERAQVAGHYPCPSVPIRGSMLFRSAFAFLAVLVMVAICHAAQPATGASPSQSAATTYPHTIDLTGTTRPADDLHYFATPPTPVMVTLNYTGTSIEEVLNDLSRKTGYIFVKTAPVGGRITLRSEKPVSSDEMLPFLDAALEADDYGVLPMGRVLVIDTRIDLTFIGLSGPAFRIGTDPDQIPDTDNVIAHQIIPVKNLPADQLLKELRSSVPDINVDAPDYTTPPSGNLIIANDTPHNVRRVLQAVRNLDKPPTTGPTTTPATMPHAESGSRGGQ